MCKEPSINDWAAKVPLWSNGLGIGFCNMRSAFNPHTVHYGGDNGNSGFSQVEAPCLGCKWPKPGGLDFKKGEII